MTQRKTVATGRDVQADELRTAKGAGEAQEQQRAVPGAQEVVRQLRQHVAQVCDEDRGLTLLRGPMGAPAIGWILAAPAGLSYTRDSATSQRDPQNMASPPNALRKSPVVSVVIPKDLLATLDDYRWDNRMSRSQAIVKAVRKYLDQPEAPADAWRRRGLR